MGNLLRDLGASQLEVPCARSSSFRDSVPRIALSVSGRVCRVAHSPPWVPPYAQWLVNQDPAHCGQQLMYQSHRDGGLPLIVMAAAQPCQAFRARREGLTSPQPHGWGVGDWEHRSDLRLTILRQLGASTIDDVPDIDAARQGAERVAVIACQSRRTKRVGNDRITMSQQQ